jgi:teichoic acid transport system permease protein
MADTTVADPDSGLALRSLAARYGLHVAGQRPSLAAYTRALWAYRHFIAAYARAKALVTYTTTRLGQLWQVLTPLANAAVYYLIFGIILHAGHGIPNFIAYLCTGIFVFNFTSAVMGSGVQSITGNLGLIRALHFPRASLPIAVTLVQLQVLLAAMVVLIGIILVTGEPLTAKWLLVVPALLLQSVFNVGLALVMARLGAKITDLKQLVPFVTRTWMYASGVLYNVALFEQHLPHAVAKVVQGNPLLIYIELVRHALLESVPLSSPPLQLWLLGAGWAAVAGFGGYVYFWRGEQEYGRG